MRVFNVHGRMDDSTLRRIVDDTWKPILARYHPTELNLSAHIKQKTATEPLKDFGQTAIFDQTTTGTVSGPEQMTAIIDQFKASRRRTGRSL